MGIVLASASPRRRKLLGKVLARFSVKTARINESIRTGESFSSAAMRLAEKKAESVAKKEKNAIVIGADTIAYRGKRIYRKTGNATLARKILRELSGKTHFVVTGVAVIFPDGKRIKYAVKAAVKMRRLDDKLLDWYLKSGEWQGRAGCYDVSGKGRRRVQSVKGEKETVVGLPLKRLRLLLKKN